MSGETHFDLPPRDEASYLIVNEEWRVIAVDEFGSFTADTDSTSLLEEHVSQVIGPEALAHLQERGRALFTVDNVDYVLTASVFHLPSGTIRVIRAQEMQATLEHVVSLIVHEVRNPLSAMRALVQGLEEELDDASGALAYTSRLKGEIDRLSRLLGSMSQFARLRAQPPVMLKPQEVLSRAAAVFQPELAQRDIRLQVTVTPRVGQIRADPDQIQQMLVNLVTNAAEAMPRGGTITLRARLDGRGRTMLQVEDTGVGMSEDAVERALRPRQSSKPGGMGLGLMIVRGIVRQHEGRMRVSSAPGKGTTISITFPAIADSAALES